MIKSMASLVEDICHKHKKVLTEAQHKQLQLAARQAVEKTTMIAFGGHYKCGKSTVLNVALGRNILPVDELPETGTICRVRSWCKDGVTVHTTSGEQFDVPCTTESIQAFCSIVSDGGARRQEVASVQYLDIRLERVHMPANSTWLDSPGINDHPDMDDRAAQAADRSDVLVWVLASKQALSQAEMDFLANHLEANGPSSVVFVLNAFLPTQDQNSWEAFSKRNLPRIQAKLKHFLDGLVEDPKLITLCALDAAARPGRGFGCQAFNAVMREVSRGDNSCVVNTRRFRLARTIRSVLQEMSESLQEAQAQHASDAAAAADVAARALRRWKQSVDAGIDEYLQELDPVIARCADRVCQRIDGGVVLGSAHCDQLNLELGLEMGLLARQLKSRLRNTATALERGVSYLAAVDDLKDIPQARFQVKEASLKGDQAQDQMKRWARAGLLRGGPLGALLVNAGETALGQIDGLWNRKTRTMEQAKDAVLAAAGVISEALRQRCAEVRNELLAPAQDVPLESDRKRIYGLQQAVQDLEELHRLVSAEQARQAGVEAP